MQESSQEPHVDVLIVGAGPAGLAAAHRCQSEGVSFILIETGQSLENRQDQALEDLGSGVGGSGLYSDGKLSFYPSAHALWSLSAERLLREAYGWLQNLTVDLVGHFPPFPDVLYADDHSPAVSSQMFDRKDYISLVLGPKERRELVQRLLGPIRHRIRVGTRVGSIVKHGGIFDVTLEHRDASIEQLKASRIILCPGRYGSHLMPRISPELDTIFRRFEFGVRIEQPLSSFFLRDDPTTDTKLLFSNPDQTVAWRTFCCCRDGVVLASRLGQLQTYSGTSCSSSGLSNIGFNCRVLSASLFAELLDETTHVLSGKVAAFSLPIQEYIESTSGTVLYGPKLDSLLRKGLCSLGESFDLANATLYGPCIEGTGIYPKLTAQLETSVQGVYVAGDATGIFRGLVPAFLSGVYVAANASRELTNNLRTMSSDTKIKISPSDSMPLAFTAQSKKFFYCRDTVCEYTFKQGFLPINPFRVFDYFLSDRIERDLVRRSNNQLIRSCDELWVFGPLADGVLFELFLAAHLGKPIRFFTISTHGSEIRPIESVDDLTFEPEVHAPKQKRETLLNELRRLLENSISRRQRTLFDLM